MALPASLACLAQTSPGERREAASPAVALTFDDLPETGDVAPNTSRARIGARIVAALQSAHAPPVYGFINAGDLDDPAVAHLLARWRAAGFLLGNHTFSHSNPDQELLPTYERDILRNEPVLRRFMPDADWRWFRYPYLAEGATLPRRHAIRAFLAQHGYRVAEVTIDFSDWAFNEPYARCVAGHDASSIARMKSMYVAAAKESIRFSQERSQRLFGRDIPHVMLLHYGGFEAVMLPTLLKILADRNFRLVPLPQAESDPVYALDPAVANDGGTLLDDFMQARGLRDTPHTPPPLQELDRMCR